MSSTDPSSRLITSARAFDEPVSTANIPVYRASTVLMRDLEEARRVGEAVGRGDRHATSYGTAGTPTTMALMDAVAELEAPGHECRAALMPSGLSAISTLLLALLRPGDHLLVPDSVYGPTRSFCDGMLRIHGVEVEYYHPAIGAGIESSIRPNTRLVYLESPGSYTFEIQDTPAICAAARRHGVLTAVDNAWASPVFARPFDWGVDASVLPLTKYWSGHSDVLMGAAVVRAELWPRLWSTVRELGLCVGGDDAYLILRGLRTAEVRMRRHQENGLAVARWLAGRPEVARVLHPGLPDHPQHALWQRDFSGASGLFGFELTREATRNHGAGFNPATAALCERRRHFGIGYSWGGFESLIMPARLDAARSVEPWTGGALIRVHIGLEDPAALIADLEEGFSAMRAVPRAGA